MHRRIRAGEHEGKTLKGKAIPSSEKVITSNVVSHPDGGCCLLYCRVKSIPFFSYLVSLKNRGTMGLNDQKSTEM